MHARSSLSSRRRRGVATTWYAPDLAGLHTQGETLEEATANAEDALALDVEGLREYGASPNAGVIRRRFPP
jgi:hypothetical protein